MQVIMLKDVDKVGDKHEVVTVKNGFGRNYLIPRGLALIANKTNLGRLAEMTRREEAQEQKKLDDYKAMAEKVQGKTLKIGAKASSSGRIFGSITQLQVIGALQEQFGIEVERKKVVLPETAKEIGEYELTLKLHKEVMPTLTMAIVEE
ncbi:MAG: 50S ribosomal protein L9 [Bacteroidota bacterium]